MFTPVNATAQCVETEDVNISHFSSLPQHPFGDDVSALPPLRSSAPLFPTGPKPVIYAKRGGSRASVQCGRRIGRAGVVKDERDLDIIKCLKCSLTVECKGSFLVLVGDFDLGLSIATRVNRRQQVTGNSP